MKNFHLFLAAALLLFLSACQEEGPETPSGPLPAPQNVHCTDVTSTSLTFAWDAVDGAEKYAVRLKTASDGVVVEAGYATSATYTFSDLETGTSYICMVRAIAGDRFSEFVSSSSYVPGESTPDPDPEPDPDPDMTEAYNAMLIPSAEDDHGLTLAFPGAEGGGMYTTGGRGGKVLHVTTLDDTGAEGSLRWAINQSGARIIVFDVAGRIELQSELRIRNGNLTIAGQTAPGDGICLSGNTVRVDADNVIIRFMRFRLGYAGNPNADGEDTIWGRYHENIILDHCSMSWSVDEVASFYANRNFTMQWCMLSEALRNSGHSKGGHGYGGIWGGKNASFHHNLLAHNDSRNARIDHPGIYIQDNADYRATHRGNVDYRNNVIYNYGDNSTYGGEDGHFNIVGNYYKPGPASRSDRRYFVDAYWYNSSSQIGSAYPELYIEGNFHTAGIDESRYPDGIYYHNQGENPEPVILSSPLSIKADDETVCYTTTHSAESAYNTVTECAGASLCRDDVDERVAGNVINGDYSYKGSNGSTGGLIDSQNDVGGWPSYSATTANEANDKTDSDGDGIPDWFEDKFGLNSKDSSDAASKTIDIHGRYTNFEMYLHYLVRNIVASQTSGGTYTSLD